MANLPEQCNKIGRDFLLNDNKQFRSEQARKNYEKAERQRERARMRKARKAMKDEMAGKAWRV